MTVKSDMFYKAARALQGDMVEDRRYLHQNPEISLDLPLTKEYVRKRLLEMGYEPVECGKGILATVGGKKGGKVFLIRGDMDALPIAEETDEDFKSVNGNMHACGHDMHTAMLLGAARLLKDAEEELNGTVKLMFQAGEETLVGALAMIEDGILENPKVDAAMNIHVGGFGPLPAGAVILLSPGPAFASSDSFNIIIKGRGGHGAMPDTTVDPINVAVHLHTALQTINSRELPPGESAVLTVGLLQGGSAYNIIPDTVRMGGTIRTFNPEIRDIIKGRVVEISRGIANTFRAEVVVDYPTSCPALLIDKDLAESAHRYLGDLLGADSVYLADQIMPNGGKVFGSEDFGFISERVPTFSVLLSASANSYPLHHPKVVFDESPLYRGAAVYAYSAIKWLEEN